jgi:hypothetical protein
MASQQPEETDLASRYGRSELAHIATLGKSGLTPVNRTTPKETLSQEQQDIENNQRQWLVGFTTRELERAGCLTKAQIQPRNLPDVLHPIFERERWEKNRTPINNEDTLDGWND